MSAAYVHPAVALVDQVGYLRCLDCGPGDWPIIDTYEANNCALEGERCETCGRDMTPLYDTRNLVHVSEYVPPSWEVDA